MKQMTPEMKQQQQIEWGKARVLGLASQGYVRGSMPKTSARQRYSS
jgi:hypothetical protein